MMLNRDHKYNYMKIFFRRPVWTDLNVLFLKSLVITTVILLSLTLASVRFYNQYPTHRIQYKVKQNYISRIVEYYENNEPAVRRSGGEAFPGYMADIESLPGTIENKEVDIAEVEKFMEKAVSERSAVSKVTEKVPGKVSAKEDEYDQSLVAFLNTPEETSLKVRNAISEIPALVVPSPSNRYTPMEPYNARKKAYESGVKKFSTTKQDNIAIAEADFTDFEIVTGMRDYEQTISVANDNKKFVKRCIDKLYRNDPTVRGNIVVKFDIHPEGYVIASSIRVVKSDIKDSRVVKCIKRTISRWRNFPQVAYEMGEYSLTQKYIF